MRGLLDALDGLEGLEEPKLEQQLAEVGQGVPTSRVSNDDVDFTIVTPRGAFPRDAIAAIDDVIAERVIAREVIELDEGAARVNDAVADGATLGEITKLVQRDARLAENISALARSPAFTGSVGERVSLPYSIMRLGAQGVRGVCLTSSLAKEAMRPGPLLSLRRAVWRECLASALCCQAIAGTDGVSPDDASLLGLMHDFGKIVALLAIEPDVAVDAPPPIPFWTEVAERHHYDAGWVVADAWRLPAAVPTITATHHRPHVGRGLHGVVVRADRVVAAAAKSGWQISADDIVRIPGIKNADEAMAIRIALAKHPYWLTAIK
jgi:HD-like signal output (HDOD) protein